ncbi:MAG: OsmC family protein [Planctomycetes bacterium]|nr:OsmC family protein [Planctomycetota bacterium]
MTSGEEWKFGTNLEWTGAHEGVHRSPGKQDIPVSCPSMFCGGRDDLWTPEDFFVASLECCLMMTFLHYAEKISIELRAYRSRAEGVAKLIEKRTRFDRVHIRPEIEVADEKSAKKARQLIHNVKRACLVTHSLNPDIEITMDAKITVADG